MATLLPSQAPLDPLSELVLAANRTVDRFARLTGLDRHAALDRWLACKLRHIRREADARFARLHRGAL